jgi:hypothetical protein
MPSDADSAATARVHPFHKSDDGDDRMNEKEEDVVHAASYQTLKNSQNSGRFWNSPPTRLPAHVAGL